LNADSNRLLNQPESLHLAAFHF